MCTKLLPAPVYAGEAGTQGPDQLSGGIPPSTRLHKISFGLAAKLVAYNTMSAFRGNLGEEYIQYNIESIYKMFFKEQAFVKLNSKEELEVTIFGHPHHAVLQEIYSNLSEKLLDKGLEPGASWLGGYPLKFISK